MAQLKCIQPTNLGQFHIVLERGDELAHVKISSANTEPEAWKLAGDAFMNMSFNCYGNAGFDLQTITVTKKES